MHSALRVSTAPLAEVTRKTQTYATPWFYIHGEDVHIRGSNQSEWGGFYSFGEQWWDIMQQVHI
jgi:hypothetical protein